MMVVLTMAAALWGIGAAMGTPRRARWIMIGILLLLVNLAQILLPEGNTLREATGGDARLWPFVMS